ncbi:MAG: aspartate aminotransferase family protein [Anaerolineaceae bacterium]
MKTMTTKEIFEIESKHTSGVYSKQPILFVRGEGAMLWDNDGVAYLDCTSGHGVANLGHAHPKVAAAVYAQSQKLITLFETYYNDQRAVLMEKLTGIIPELDRVFFCNSGTETIEAAIKFARISTGRPGIVAAMRGFHGRTYGSLSATYNKKYKDGFEPLLPGFSHVPFNNIEALQKGITTETAALILEIVQGEGGVYLADDEYIRAAKEVCQEKGALLIIDEVQSGFGRTGKWFAVQHSGVIPDMLCCAKSLAGGIPMGAVLISRNVKNLVPGVHGSTFGGNPLACAAALATFEVMEEEKIPDQAAEKGAYLMEKIGAIHSPLVREVRGLGLMVGIELKQKVQPYLRELQNRHVLVLNAGMTVIRLLPPLVITYDQLDWLIKELTEVLTDEIKNG